MGNEPARRKRTAGPANHGVNFRQVAPAQELIRELDDRYFMSLAGLGQAARRDRIPPGQTRRRFGHFLSEEGKSRDHYRRHDGRVISMAAKMERCGLQVSAGWRVCWNVPNLTQIDPDFVVCFGAVSVGEVPFPSLWWFGEYERSAKTPAAIADKLSSYFRLYDFLRAQGRERPGILLICDDEDVEQIFWRVGRRLLLFTATYNRVMQGALVGDSTVWIMHGEPASVSVARGNGLISWTGRHGPRPTR